MRPLFLTWDGPDQTYLESLFLPIFSRLRPLGIDVHVLQFTWAGADQLEATRRAAARLAVPYTSVRTHRRFGPAAVALSIALGAEATARYAREHAMDTFFPRSLLPAGIALLANQGARRLRLVFDADGLMADERVEFAGWDQTGLKYKILRRVEARTTRLAASVIARTEPAKSILLLRAGADVDPSKVFVISNGKDPDSVSPGTAEGRREARAAEGVPHEAPWLVYAGSLGPQYCPEAIVRLFMAVARRRPDAHLRVFTFQEQLFRDVLTREGAISTNVRVGRAEPARVAASLAAADLGLALRAETLSQRAVSPIKVAEYLLCGVPVVAGRVGDLPAQLDGKGVAFLTDGVDAAALDRVAEWFVQEVLPNRQSFRSRCRAIGEEVFGLDRCADRYRMALEHARASS